jgi:hypothetical protein
MSGNATFFETLLDRQLWHPQGAGVILDAAFHGRHLKVQGPVDFSANFVQRLTSIRRARGKILSHSGCWHAANLP